MAPGGPSRSPQSDNRGSERRRQIEGIVTAVLRLPKAERAAYLGDACAGDPELRCEVDSMIARESEAHQFLEVPALEAEARALAGTDDSIAGQVISHYRILE